MTRVLVFLVSISVHEIFHFLTARLFKEDMEVFFLPSGFSAKWKSLQPEKWVQCIICACGPVGNIIIAVLIALLPLNTAILSEFIKANLFIGIFNMIPLYPMDGGSILLILLYSSIGSNRTFSIMKRMGCGIRIVLVITGFYILVFYGNPSMFLTTFFLPGIGSVKRSVNRLNLSALIRRRERILKRKTYQMRDVLILKDVILGKALLLLDYDRYHIIHIADENLKILVKVTEQQLIDAIMQNNTGKTLEEVFIQKQ